MKRRLFALGLALCLILGGCTWMDGGYSSVQFVEPDTGHADQLTLTASNYKQLLDTLVSLVENGRDSAVISVEDFDRRWLTNNVEMAIRYITRNHPLGVYAVEEITCEPGTNGGKNVLAVNIVYRYTLAQMRQIETVVDMDAAQSLIGEALNQCQDSVVFRVKAYEAVDFVQFVRDYADENPQWVMEVPQVTQAVYPDSGLERMVELKFTYHTSRNALRGMQSNVQTVFRAAELSVMGDYTEAEKYAMVYSFLMERFDYQYDSSITPAYSLLRHGTGDSRAFAVVYREMCDNAGIACQVISGTRDGEAWFWNIIYVDGVYYHLDLIRCQQRGRFAPAGDAEMAGYVWDYSAYPACGSTQQLPGDLTPQMIS